MQRVGVMLEPELSGVDYAGDAVVLIVCVCRWLKLLLHQQLITRYFPTRYIVSPSKLIVS